mmetsp:Transcript_22448/g.32155  ORF Transcript_22448/g.32155 Transcript_22448/m.32155 type:complete len:101 (+) Transcript_22448:52-354(+)
MSAQPRLIRITRFILTPSFGNLAQLTEERRYCIAWKSSFVIDAKQKSILIRRRNLIKFELDERWRRQKESIDKKYYKRRGEKKRVGNAERRAKTAAGTKT